MSNGITHFDADPEFTYIFTDTEVAWQTFDLLHYRAEESNKLAYIHG